MTCDAEPVACSSCGARLVRVINGWRGYLSARDRAATEADTAVFVPDDGAPTPEWVCLACAPEWREAHRLAMQDYGWQLAKEEAVAPADFDTACSIREQQDRFRPALQALLRRLRSRTQPSQ